jgi:hypothetical protein
MRRHRQRPNSGNEFPAARTAPNAEDRVKRPASDLVDELAVIGGGATPPM